MDWVADLFTLTDEDWDRYTLNRDPLIGKISPSDQREFCLKASTCGVELARRLQKDYPSSTLDQIGASLGVDIEYSLDETGSGYTLFASFKEPKTITVYVPNALETDRVLEEQGLRGLIGGAKTTDVLLAHELFHFLEYTWPDIYTARKLLTLWKVGRIENRSRILSLQEIGAMAFAKELLGLKCPANSFTILMLLPKNPQQAKKLFEDAKNSRENEREKQ